MTIVKRTAWNDDGFASPPAEITSNGGEVVYRAYGGASGVLGNCFFAPAIGVALICNWTAELLEIELNAALWGNDFEGITRFEIKPDVNYRIGPIAHTDYAGWEGDPSKTFFQRSFITPSGIFKQVKFVLEDGVGLIDCVKQLGESFKIPPGNFARKASLRARENANKGLWN